MNTRLSHLQTQRQTLAPSMQQSIEVLLLPITELNSAIEEELEKNPLLEVEEKPAHSLSDIQINQILHHNSQPSDQNQSESYNQNDDFIEEKPLIKDSLLEEHLLQQLKLEIIDSLALKIGEFIIGNLDEDGYLTISCEDIARQLNIPDISQIESILRLVQGFDPLGIAARSLKECLLIQSPFVFNGEYLAISELIENHLEDLGGKKYSDIARKMKITLEKVREFARKIALLEPRPARNFRPLPSNIYIKPDVIVIKNDGEYQIVVNKENIPRLRISSVYQNMLKNPNLTAQEKDYIHEKVHNAVLFIKSIEQRNSTLRQIAKYIVNYQRDFFENGYLKPLILKDVATFVERNESTVSRAINNKYMQTPHGLFAMKYFFSQAISNSETNQDVSNQSVKEEIKTLIESEDKAKPLSDSEILHYINDKGMKIARRTISKYRQALKILPSHLRKI